MKIAGFVAIIFILIVFQFCSTARRVQEQPKVTYAAHVQPIIQAHCSPCHTGGKQEALNNYTNAKSHIDDILTRIQKNPGEKGFMPMKHPKLPDSTIQVFMKWKADGLLEK